MHKAPSDKTNRDETTRARRTLLVEAAITCFVEQGVARASMRDIAEKAGVSVGNLYNHFPSRDDLIAEIARMETAGIADVIEKVEVCSAPSEAIDTFVRSYFAFCAKPVSAVLTVEITSEALRNPSIDAMFRETRSRLIKTVAKLLEVSDQAPPNAVLTAGFVIDTIDAFAVRVGLGGKGPKKQETEALLSFVRSALATKDL